MDLKHLTIIILLLTLIFLISVQKPGVKMVKELSKKDVGKKYLFQANYSQVFVKQGFSLYNMIQGGSSVRLVFFRTVLLDNQSEVEGVIQYYNGSLEVVGLRVF